ncbi:MAG TPA: hypothetical protein EYO94_08330 [Acidobacteria bacterium]|nr:hypothetical protein [Acidobacteriota bacterium]
MPHGNHRRKTAAGVVAVFLLFYWTLPNESIEVESSVGRNNQVRGVFHVHSTESDGGGTVEEIANAARAANLDFVILTDHGDGTKSSSPRYIQDVLIISGIEISTDTGHYIAVGMRQAPYPLGGDAKGVVEDVRRLGGLGVVAHPYSPRGELSWQDFTLPVDAIEWINGDSQWRSTGVLSLLSAGLHYFFRPVGSLTRVLHRPTDAMNMWDAMASNASVVGLAGLDAHARLATGSGDEGYAGGFVFRFPWYEELFRLFSIQVNLDRTQTGNAGADALNLLTSIQTGHVYSSVEGRATPAELTFFASLSNGDIVEMGDRTPSNQELQLVAKVNGPRGAAIRLLRNGTIVSESTNLELTYSVNSSDASAVYRTEVYLSEFAEEDDLPWIVSNPIFIGSRETVNLPSTPFREIYGANPNAWRTEQYTDAEVTLDLNADILTLTYTLGNSPATYAAMTYDIGTERITSDVSIDFVVRASKPMRISAQLRHGAGEDSRWRHSFYADQRDRRVRLSVHDFTPVGPPNSAKESVSGVDSLLFVADTVNYQRNSSGEIQISGLRLGEQ